ncbi:hypothetical protein EKN56_17280 [Limnobaculum zhutongyuii]|uniref:Uncharacterized protein n=1 Tax=Limnobaculum zhutongyuii TaxID=2498113 RepID=A0A411WP64_9GAMM|nr:hypothetical protein [Limnobaculum zhutongyuii]QBH97992.1 hypothetical protein EKN56_17280 [Limnobaculum zhutongyuii]TQS88149.1 hypothetical protein ELQ32_11580 [Limnobaculum zhutongyuii]
MIKVALTPIEHQSRGELVACSWSTADRLMVLEAESIPERINGQFVASQTDKRSWFVSIYQHGELILSVPSIESKTNFHYVQILDEQHILLVGARCHYNHGDPEKNAEVYNLDGQRVRRFTLGDGIEDINVTTDGAIWVSYFDEGVFGNYGWGQPLGQYGLVKFNAEGNVLWQAEQFDICDCYAVNAESEHSFWFYYYSDFQLVHLNKLQATSYRVPVQGSHAFALSHPYLIMVGGYGQNDNFHVFKFNASSLKETAKLVFTDSGGKSLKQCVYNMRGNRVIAFNQSGIYYTILTPDCCQ